MAEAKGTIEKGLGPDGAEASFDTRELVLEEALKEVGKSLNGGDLDWDEFQRLAWKAHMAGEAAKTPSKKAAD